MVSQVQSMCSECRGQGERILPKDKCKTCDGKKVCFFSLIKFIYSFLCNIKKMMLIGSV